MTTSLKFTWLWKIDAWRQKCINRDINIADRCVLIKVYLVDWLKTYFSLVQSNAWSKLDI